MNAEIEKTCDLAARSGRVFASSIRVKIVYLLIHGGPMTAGEIIREIRELKSSTYNHLLILKKSGLIAAATDSKATKSKSRVIYRVQQRQLDVAMSRLESMLASPEPTPSVESPK